MLDFKIVMIHAYHHAQKTVYVAPYPSIVLCIAGLIYRKSTSGTVESNLGPELSLYSKGHTSEFEYGPDRENWVVWLDTADIREGGSPGTVEVRSNGEWLSLPMHYAFRKEFVPGWRTEFERMKEAFAKPDPRSQLRARAGVVNVLRSLIDQSLDVIGQTQAARLKILLDQDEQHRFNIETLAGKVGGSSDHLRRLFESEYGINPLEYRNRRRMARASMLLSNSELRVQEIASLLGFNHVSQFSAFYKKRNQITPSEAIRKFRIQGRTGA